MKEFASHLKKQLFQLSTTEPSLRLSQPEDHSYVNWRVKATYVDENESTEMFPSSGFYKTWSDCWFKDGEWGGGNCPDDAEDGNSLPAIGFVAATSIALIAAIIRRE